MHSGSCDQWCYLPVSEAELKPLKLGAHTPTGASAFGVLSLKVRAESIIFTGLNEASSSCFLYSRCRMPLSVSAKINIVSGTLINLW